MRAFGTGLVALFVVAACADGDVATSDTAPPSSSVAEYPDRITREIRRLAAAPRPVPNSAIPPRHLDVERFPESLVERTRIVSGGPPIDGIPPIDEPTVEQARDVDWLTDDEVVMVVSIDGETRAYPLRILAWHEIVNDEVNGVPVVITYCPLCHSGLAFDRRVDDGVLDFGTSGSLYQSNLVMYDRQTESLWTQFDGRAVIGDRVGDELTQVPLALVDWAAARDAHPEATVLSIDTGFDRPYERSPYGAYDTRTEPLAGFFTGDVDDRAGPMTRVVALGDATEPVAVERASLAEVGVVALDVAGQPITVWHLPGARSPQSSDRVAEGARIGSVVAHDPRVDDRTLTFSRLDGRIVDAETGSEWDEFGRATGGELAGAALRPVTYVDTFWFAWATYRPETRLVVASAE